MAICNHLTLFSFSLLSFSSRVFGCVHLKHLKKRAYSTQCYIASRKEKKKKKSKIEQKKRVKVSDMQWCDIFFLSLFLVSMDEKKHAQLQHSIHFFTQILFFCVDKMTKFLLVQPGQFVHGQ